MYSATLFWILVEALKVEIRRQLLAAAGDSLRRLRGFEKFEKRFEASSCSGYSHYLV
jgi:hypothetical protein